MKKAELIRMNLTSIEKGTLDYNKLDEVIDYISWATKFKKESQEDLDKLANRVIAIQERHGVTKIEKEIKEEKTMKTTKTTTTTKKATTKNNKEEKTMTKKADTKKADTTTKKAKKEKKDLQSMLPKLTEGMTVTTNSKGHVIIKDGKFRVLGLDQKCMVITHEALITGLKVIQKGYGWRVELPTTKDIEKVLTSYADYKKKAEAKKEAEKKAAAEKKAKAEAEKKAKAEAKAKAKKAEPATEEKDDPVQITAAELNTMF